MRGSWSPRRAIIRENRRFLRLTSAIACTLGIGWIVVALSLGFIMDAAYANRALPGAALAGTDISGMSGTQIIALLNRAQDDLTVNITVGGTTKQATSADLGITVNRQQILSTVFQHSQQPLWIYQGPGPGDIPLDISIDPAQFNAWGLDNFPDYFQAPVNATVTYDQAAQRFDTTKSQPAIGADTATLDELAASLSTPAGTNNSFTVTPQPIAAPVTDDQAADAQTWLNQRLSQPCSLSNDEQTVYTLTPDEIASMTTISDDPSGGLDVGFDPTAILGFIQNTLAPLVNAAPVTQNVLTDPAGNTIDISQPGSIGRTLADTDELAQNIATCLTAGQGAAVGMSFSTVPFTTESTVTLPAANADVTNQLNYLLTYVTTYNTAQWGDYNPSGGDCANFTSQGLYVRGIPMDATWYSRGPGQASSAWTLARGMDNWMGSKGWTKLGLNQLDQLKLGDIGFFDWNDDGLADHVMTVSRIDQTSGSQTVYFVSHNDDGAYRELNDVITNQHPGANAWFYSVP